METKPGDVMSRINEENRRNQHGEGLNGGRCRMASQNVWITMTAGKYEVNADADGNGDAG